MQHLWLWIEFPNIFNIDIYSNGWFGNKNGDSANQMKLWDVFFFPSCSSNWCGFKQHKCYTHWLETTPPYMFEGVRSLSPDDFQGAAPQLIRVPCRFLGNSGKKVLRPTSTLSAFESNVPDRSRHIYIYNYVFIDIDTKWGAFPTWIDSLKLSNCSDGYCTKFSAQERDQTRCLRIPVILSPDHYVSYIYI